MYNNVHDHVYTIYVMMIQSHAHEYHYSNMNHNVQCTLVVTKATLLSIFTSCVHSTPSLSHCVCALCNSTQCPYSLYVKICIFILRQNKLDIKESQMYSTLNRTVPLVRVYGGNLQFFK